jgi:hypothetical protein
MLQQLAINRKNEFFTETKLGGGSGGAWHGMY